jgi:hypothetical protein
MMGQSTSQASAFERLFLPVHGERAVLCLNVLPLLQAFFTKNSTRFINLPGW